MMPALWRQRMSIGEAHRGTAEAPAHSERETLWAIGLSALLVATGPARRTAEGYSGRADHAELEAGRGRFAEGPSEIPARGWMDILLRVYEGSRKTASSPMQQA